MKTFLSLLLSVLMALTPMLACAEAFETLKEGDKGDAVHSVKLRLFHLGYFDSGEHNKTFNSALGKRIRAFQQNNGLEETGEVDETTWNALFAPDAVSAWPQLETIAELPVIDWPERDADGYLVGDGFFLHEDDETGFCAYLSQDLQITILKRSDPSIPLEWLETDVRLRGEQRLQTVENNPDRPGTRFKYPFDIATENGYVLGFTDDFYGHRIYQKDTVGVVIREGEILSSKTYKNRRHNLPNLDVMAQYADGSLKAFYANEKTADALLAEGAVNVFCFGPVLVRNGEIDPLVLEGWYEDLAPRQALGMYEPGHYLILTVLGRIKASEGTGIVRLARMMHARGVTEALNLDGGNTQALIFNGRMLNKLSTWQKKDSVRTVSSLIGVGQMDYPE